MEQQHFGDLLQPDLQLQIFLWLQPTELATCSAVSRDFYSLIRGSNFLWSHVYCAKFRSNRHPRLAADHSDDELRLREESSPWMELSILREKIGQHLAWHKNNAPPPFVRFNTTTLALTPSPKGTIAFNNIERIGSDRLNSPYHQGLVIFEVPVSELLLRFPGGRPLAYAEFLVDGYASIGLVPEHYHDIHSGFIPPMQKHVGWVPGSIGYHPDDGNIYCNNSRRSVPFGPPFGYDRRERIDDSSSTEPSVIGVGVMGQDLRTVFFTKNGDFVGSVSLPPPSPSVERTGRRFCHYFAVGIHNTRDSCTLNFGAQPFVFDVEAFSSSQTSALLTPEPRLTIDAATWSRQDLLGDLRMLLGPAVYQ